MRQSLPRSDRTATWYGEFAGNYYDDFMDQRWPFSARGCFFDEYDCRVWQNEAISYAGRGGIVYMRCTTGPARRLLRRRLGVAGLLRHRVRQRRDRLEISGDRLQVGVGKMREVFLHGAHPAAERIEVRLEAGLERVDDFALRPCRARRVLGVMFGMVPLPSGLGAPASHSDVFNPPIASREVWHSPQWPGPSARYWPRRTASLASASESTGAGEK